MPQSNRIELISVFLCRFEQAALRETKEEAGIDVVLKGILRVEHGFKTDYARMR